METVAPQGDPDTCLLFPVQFFENEENEEKAAIRLHWEIALSIIGSVLWLGTTVWVGLWWALFNQG